MTEKAWKRAAQGLGTVNPRLADRLAITNTPIIRIAAVVSLAKEITAVELKETSAIAERHKPVSAIKGDGELYDSKKRLANIFSLLHFVSLHKSV